MNYFYGAVVIALGILFLTGALTITTEYKKTKRKKS